MTELSVKSQWYMHLSKWNNTPPTDKYRDQNSLISSTVIAHISETNEPRNVSGL